MPSTSRLTLFFFLFLWRKDPVIWGNKACGLLSRSQGRRVNHYILECNGIAFSSCTSQYLTSANCLSVPKLFRRLSYQCEAESYSHNGRALRSEAVLPVDASKRQ